MIETVRLRILLVALAGWVNRHQLDIIDYLRAENRVLKEHLSGQRCDSAWDGLAYYRRFASSRSGWRVKIRRGATAESRVR